MPLPWALRGLRDGVLTTRWPARSDGYFDTFPASVSVSRSSEPADRVQRAELADRHVLDELCPTGALRAINGDVVLDTGACILCGRCVAAFPRTFGWAPGAGTAALRRDHLVVGAAGESDTALAAVRSELASRVRHLRRSVHIRHVDAGSDGSDEWEVQALLNPVYDVHRLGIFFTASPRHADILLVTGVGANGMVAPLQRTRAAMPDPVVVIASGTDAISGGLLGRGYATRGGIADLLDVDVWVPGAPASPFSLLHGILLALGRLPASEFGAGPTGPTGTAGDR